MKIRILTGLIVLCLSFMFICCDEDKVTSPGGGDDPPVKITRGNCIELLEEAFNEIDIKKYRRLLLKPDTSNVFSDGYIWHNQEEDLQSEYVQFEYLDYYQDIEATDSLFTHIHSVEFIIFPGEWGSVEVFRKTECSDCWETVRDYKIDVEDDMEFHFMGEYLIRLVIGPDPEMEGSYLIYQAKDLRQGATIKRIPADSETESWGAIKSAYARF